MQFKADQFVVRIEADLFELLEYTSMDPFVTAPA